MKQILACTIWLCLTFTMYAQGVFQASLGMQSDGGAHLFLGNFWFKVENDELDFILLVSLPTAWSGLNPVLSVPGSSVEFSPGEAQTGLFIDAQHTAQNPFLPSPQWKPAGYDDDGNPYYLMSPGFFGNNYYSGHFTLPPGFLDELLAGNGKIELNSFIGGNITVATVPEPTTMFLSVVAGGWLIVCKRKRALIHWFKKLKRQTAVSPDTQPG